MTFPDTLLLHTMKGLWFAIAVLIAISVAFCLRNPISFSRISFTFFINVYSHAYIFNTYKNLRHLDDVIFFKFDNALTCVDEISQILTCYTLFQQTGYSRYILCSLYSHANIFSTYRNCVIQMTSFLITLSLVSFRLR